MTPTRVEVVTTTGAGNRYVGRGPVTSAPATVDTIEARLLSKVPAGRPGQLTAPLPGVPIGGTVAVHIPQPGPNGAGDVADAMRRLAPELIRRPELTRVEFYLPGRPPIVYVRQPAGTYLQI